MSTHDKSVGLGVDEIRKDFAGVRALSDVSLSLSPGELLGLIGPNGSGKTTLVNIISGLIGPTSGSVVIDGADVTGHRELDEIVGTRLRRRGVEGDRDA